MTNEREFAASQSTQEKCQIDATQKKSNKSNGNGKYADKAQIMNIYNT